ncbi:geranylgeranyl diphosphate synthase [Lineolata rhizophorae]|uniref:Geranylgeranyl diphosphate synthase n=1 Tax=Lineolata rhizophorae TaxID=578093 RepID=A0A6A6NPD2_9PEZI|nr:geranylgeranyl diphosphate synthase [Lineolata rhizophorae]
MVSDAFKSPNAIPPRTSSAAPGSGSGRHARAASAGLASSSSKSVLRPLAEIDWLSSSKKASAEAGPSHHQLASKRSQSLPAAKHVYPVPMTPPPENPLADGVGDELILRQGARWSSAKDKILLGPYDYLFGHPGKDIRSQLISAFNAWLKVPEDSLKVITKVVGMLHTASLLVDDVEDSSLLRRGVPVAHSIFGTAQTINSANYVYFLALRELSKLKSPQQAIDIYTEELLNLHRGQGMDLFWRDTLTCPTEADYLEMVGNKTGGLFRLAVKLMQAESAVEIDCVPLVNTIGLLFQIADDHLNLLSPSYTFKKGLCEDLTEGKFSFPVIHAIRSDPANLVILNILKQKTKDDDVKRYAVAYMEKMGSFAYARKVMEELETRARVLVEETEKELSQSGQEGRREGAEGVRKIIERLRVQ